MLSVESASSIGSTEADGIFYILHVVVSNTDKKTHDVSTAIMQLLDDQEREFDPSSQGGTALLFAGDKDTELFSAQVQPGVVKRFSLVYDAPANTRGLKLKIPAGTFSLNQDAVIKVPTTN